MPLFKGLLLLQAAEKKFVVICSLSAEKKFVVICSLFICRRIMVWVGSLAPGIMVCVRLMTHHESSAARLCSGKLVSSASSPAASGAAMPPKDNLALPPAGPGWCWKVECGYVFVSERVSWTMCVRAGDWTAAESYVLMRGYERYAARRQSRSKSPKRTTYQ